jgi:hypothetical protein
VVTLLVGNSVNNGLTAGVYTVFVHIVKKRIFCKFLDAKGFTRQAESHLIKENRW